MVDNVYRMVYIGCVNKTQTGRTSVLALPVFTKEIDVNDESITVQVNGVKHSIYAIRRLQESANETQDGVTFKTVLTHEGYTRSYKVRIYSVRSVGFYADILVFRDGESTDEFTVRASDMAILLERIADLTTDNGLVSAILL